MPSVVMATLFSELTLTYAFLPTNKELLVSLNLMQHGERAEQHYKATVHSSS